ncbi:MAG: hypothetical protein JWR88_148 [Pseudonocardia sp.]|nr:hypothetical protein [Pseudonocardia sp.]
MTEPAGRWREALAERVPQHASLVLVLLIVATAFVRLAAEHWREGALLLGGSLLVAAALRAVLPRVKLGVLAVRGRGLDILCYSALGLAVIGLASTITRTPFGG